MGYILISNTLKVNAEKYFLKLTVLKRSYFNVNYISFQLFRRLEGSFNNTILNKYLIYEFPRIYYESVY